MLSWIQSADTAVLHWIGSVLRCDFMDFIMPKITALGNVGAVWLVAAAVMTVSKKYRRYGITLLAALAAGVLVGNVCLKNLIARPRPCWLEEVSLLIAAPADYSFPSGHTLSSVIGAYILTAADRRFGAAAVPLAALIAFSRLYLYVHFPSDVLSSVVIGIVISAAAIRVMRKFSEKRSGALGQPAVH